MRGYKLSVAQYRSLKEGLEIKYYDIKIEGIGTKNIAKLIDSIHGIDSLDGEGYVISWKEINPDGDDVE